MESKDICIKKMVMMMSAVASMEYIALDNMICLQLFLYENQFLIKLNLWGIIAHLELDKCIFLIIYYL